MKYKPDWTEAKERLTALWHGEIVDRPCIAVTAPAPSGTPQPKADSPEQQWTDPDFLRQATLATVWNTWWGGEAIPSRLVMCGWIVCFGGTPRFERETIWWEEMPFDFHQPPALAFNPDAPWVQRFERAYMAVVELAGRDDFLVGHPCLLPANDLLSMLMGTERFLMGLIDHPEWMREAITMGALAQAEASRYFTSLVRERHEFWYGNAGWMPFWAPEPYRSTQSDVSCMLSPAMYDQFVLPELEVLHETGGPLWYHLDGGDAQQHLDRLLSLPYLRVLQYTPAPFEPPNGPGHLELYRRVQAAGKILHISLPVENVLPLCRDLDPTLMLLDTGCPDQASGRELLEQAAQTP